MSKPFAVEVARISLTSPRKGAAASTLESRARKLLQQLRSLGAMPADLEVCEFAHDVFARESQLWLNLHLVPRAQDVLTVDRRPPASPERLRQAVERDASKVRVSLGNLAVEVELAVARIQARLDAQVPLVTELSDACTKAVLELAGRSIDFEIGGEALRLEIPGIERSFLEEPVRMITAVVDKVGRAGLEISAVAEHEPTAASRSAPLLDRLTVTTALVDRPERFDPIFVASMRRRRHIDLSVRARLCSITGRCVGAALTGVNVPAPSTTESMERVPSGQCAGVASKDGLSQSACDGDKPGAALLQGANM